MTIVQKATAEVTADEAGSSSNAEVHIRGSEKMLENVD
jgi:hypothetical protein